MLIEEIMNSNLLNSKINFSCGLSTIHLLDESRLASVVNVLNPKAMRSLISSLTFIDWSIEFIAEYEHKWDWSSLSQNSSLPWPVELIEKYKDSWNWSNLSQNSSLHWSVELIEKYKDS